MEVNNMNIRTWIHDQDLAKLEKVVWEGNGHLLLKHTSSRPKIRKFIEAVPRLMNDIKNLHSGECFTVLNFTASQILREIKFGNFGGSKSAILAILAALLGIFNTIKCRIFSKVKIQGLQNSHNYSF